MSPPPLKNLTLFPTCKIRTSSTLPPKKNNPPESMILPNASDDRGWYSLPLYSDADLQDDQREVRRHTIKLEWGEDDDVRSVERVDMQFQGGFVGNGGGVKFETFDGTVYDLAEKVKSGTWEEAFEESNDIQSVEFEDCSSEGLNTKVKSMTIQFEGSTDFYGRVIIYLLQVYGS